MTVCLTPRFADLCRTRWGLTDEEIENRWQGAMSDVRIPKGVDEEGWQTIAKYGIQSLSSGRELSHNRALSTTTETEAHDQQLKGVMTSSLSYVTMFFVG